MKFDQCLTDNQLNVRGEQRHDVRSSVDSYRMRADGIVEHGEPRQGALHPRARPKEIDAVNRARKVVLGEEKCVETEFVGQVPRGKEVFHPSANKRFDCHLSGCPYNQRSCRGSPGKQRTALSLWFLDDRDRTQIFARLKHRSVDINESNLLFQHVRSTCVVRKTQG